MRTPVAALLLLLLAACSSGMNQGGRQSSRLDRDELNTVEARDAYQAVERLRPLWLDKRTAPHLEDETAILVYVDGARFGELETLRDIPLVNVQSMRVLDHAEMTALIGTEFKIIARIIAVQSRVRNALSP